MNAPFNASSLPSLHRLHTRQPQNMWRCPGPHLRRVLRSRARLLLPSGDSTSGVGGSSGAPIHGSVEQRIACREGGEAAEVPVGRPEIRDPVRNARGGNPGVVDHRSPDPSGKKLFLENRPVRAGFGEQFGHRRLKPGVHLIDRLRDRRRRVVHPGMTCDGDELVDARPWNAPQHGSFRKGSNAGARPAMPFRIGPVRVDEEVGVRCDQLPRPS